MKSEDFSVFIGKQFELKSLDGNVQRGQIASAKLTGQHESAGVRVEYWSSQESEAKASPPGKKVWVCPLARSEVKSEGGQIRITTSEGEEATFGEASV
jgi:hypothetical protein